jgi:hypothetical protein
MDIADRERLIKLIGMLGSSFDGERATAARFIEKIARDHKLTINEAIAQAHNGMATPDERRAILENYRRMEAMAKQREEALKRELIREREARVRAEMNPKLTSKPQPQPRTAVPGASDMLDALAKAAEIGFLTPWEQQFAEDVSGRYQSDYELSPKQIAIVERILAKVKT